jgi:hypothetical protein
MNRFALLTLVVASSAFADLKVFNVLPGEYRAEVTKPNGDLDKRNLSGASPGASSASFIFSPGPKTVPVSIFDDAGELVWKGTAGVNDAWVLVPDGKGVKAIFAGTYGDRGARVAMLLNVTGEPLSVDLVGNNGLAAHRNLKPGTSFDAKQAVKLDPRESTFKILAKMGDDDAIDLNSSLIPSTYSIFFKNTQGLLKVVHTGYVVKK